LAADEKVAADAAVKARSAANVSDGGPLLEARTTANTDWTTAKGATGQAEGNLTAALDGSVLATLR